MKIVGCDLHARQQTIAARLITKSSVAADSCGRRGKPKRGCLTSTVVLRKQ
jgi:hypothetical protein